MARLPEPGGDKGNWGAILNDFLQAAHEADGGIKPIPQSKVDDLVGDLNSKANLAGANFTGPLQLQDGSDAISEDTFNAQGPSGRELAYAESSAVQTGITSVVDVTNLTITFDVGARPVWIEAFLPFVYASAAATNISLIITDEANAIRSGATVTSPASNAGQQLIVRERISTPGTYTRKARIYRFLGPGTIGLNFDSTTIASITASEK